MKKKGKTLTKSIRATTHAEVAHHDELPHAQFFSIAQRRGGARTVRRFFDVIAFSFFDERSCLVLRHLRVRLEQRQSPEREMKRTKKKKKKKRKKS
jgi:hypothetical protein